MKKNKYYNDGSLQESYEKDADGKMIQYHYFCHRQHTNAAQYDIHKNYICGVYVDEEANILRKGW